MAFESIKKRPGKRVTLVVVACALVLAARWYGDWSWSPDGTSPSGAAPVVAHQGAGKAGARAEPWQSLAGGQNGATPAGEIIDEPQGGEMAPAPSVPTPVLDAWLSGNMDKADGEFTAGLLEFAADGKQPVDERAAALTHALNMLADKDYTKLGPLLTSDSTPARLLQQILDNAHNRGERPAVWAGLALMKRGQRELADGARELVAFLLDLDAASDAEAIRLQGETRLIEMEEAAGRAGSEAPALPVSNQPDAVPPGS